MKALPLNINKLITGTTVEWARIEFKKGWNPLKVLHTICAFANDFDNWNGGYIIIGIDEKNGRPVLPPEGIQLNIVDKIQRKLVELCHKLKPVYIPQFEPIDFQKKKILVICVPGGNERPYEAPENLKRGATYSPYIRRGSVTKKTNPTEKTELYTMSPRIPFDDQANMNAKITDLNLMLIQSHLAEINSSLLDESKKIPFSDLCRRMNIVSGADENLKPKNVGLLLFNETPDAYFSGAIIDVVIFHDEIGDKLSEKKFTGPIQHQINSVLTYLNNNVVTEYVNKLPDKAEALRYYNYPFEALEEALVNAVYHRSYQDDSPVEIRVLNDRIEILSYPGPLPPLNNENLKVGNVSARKYRNRRIGDFLKELRLTEGRGTGFPKIRNAMKNNGSPDPIFETDEDRSFFLTRLYIHPKAQVIVDEEPRVEDTKSRILNYCVEPKKRIEILTMLGLSNQTKNFETHIKPLIEKGLLRLTIPEKPRSKNQRYCTTSKGKRNI